MPVGKNAADEWVTGASVAGIPREPQDAPIQVVDPTYVEDYGTATQCPDSPTRKHEVDFASLAPRNTNDTDDCLVDINCKHCGRSGAFRVDSQTEIDW